MVMVDQAAAWAEWAEWICNPFDCLEDDQEAPLMRGFLFLSGWPLAAAVITLKKSIQRYKNRVRVLPGDDQLDRTRRAQTLGNYTHAVHG